MEFKPNNRVKKQRGLIMVIGETKKKSKEIVRISVKEFKGYQFCDVRVYYKDPSGEWKPTKKGITLNAEDIDEVIDLLRNACGELSKNGIART